MENVFFPVDYDRKYIAYYGFQSKKFESHQYRRGIKLKVHHFWFQGIIRKRSKNVVGWKVWDG